MCKLYWSVYRISSFRVNKSANSLTDISNIKKTRRNEEEDMNCNLAVIKGDGIGPEIVTEAMRVLDAVDRKSTRLNSSHASKSRMPSSA